MSNGDIKCMFACSAEREYSAAEINSYYKTYYVLLLSHVSTFQTENFILNCYNVNSAASWTISKKSVVREIIVIKQTDSYIAN